MELDTLRLKTFEHVIPICESLVDSAKSLDGSNTRTLTRHLDQLLKALETVDDPEKVFEIRFINLITRSLLEAFLLSVRSNNRPSHGFLEGWLKCMLFMLTKTSWEPNISVQEQTQLFTLFSSCIQPPPSWFTEKVPEEIQQLAVQCFSAILPANHQLDQSADTLYRPRLEELCQDQCQPMLSSCVSNLLNVIKSDTSRDLRLSALETLSNLLLKNIRRIDRIAIFFPGVVSTLCRTIYQKKEKENHKIIVTTLDVLGDVIEAVMRDDENELLIHNVRSMNDLHSIDIASLHRNTQENAEATLETESTDTVKRATEWHRSTKEKLKTMLKSILTTHTHTEWRARLAYVKFATKLLSTCAQMLENCVDLLVATLAIHRDDPYDQVAIACKQGMHNNITQSPTYLSTIMPVMKEELYKSIVGLPRCLMSGDGQMQSDAMALIIGYLLLLGHHAESVLDTALKRSSDGWLAAFALDTESIHVLDEKPGGKYIDLQENTRLHGQMYPRIRFKYLVTDQSVAQMARMLNVIGKNGDLQHWIDFFMRYLSAEDTETQPQAAFVVYSLLEGRNLEEDEDFLVERELDGLQDTALRLLHDIMSLSLSSHTSDTQNVLVQQSTQGLDRESAQILTICFELKIIGLSAFILGQDTIQQELITLIYPLLAYLGSPNVFVHTFALITLDNIALVCGEEDGRALSIANIDYVINMVSQRMTMLATNPRAPLVLRALVRIGGMGAVVYLEDSVEEIYDALDRYWYDDWLCGQLCGVLFEIIKVLRGNSEKQITAEEKVPQKTPSDGVSEEIKELISQPWDKKREKLEDDVATLEEIGRYFMDRQQKNANKSPNLRDVLEEEMVRESEEKNIEDQEPKEPAKEERPSLSKEQTMALSIMKKIGSLLTAKSSHLRSQMLSLLSSGATVLADQPVKLNTLINTLWPFIINRLGDEHFVAFNATELIKTLSSISGDFISKRIVNDIWPRFKLLLAQTTHANALPSYSPFSYTHRLQCCILSTLAHVAQHVPLPQSIVMEILEETRFFMSVKVREDLQQEVVDLFLILGATYSDTVWFCCFAMLGEHVSLKPTSKLLEPCRVPACLVVSSKDFVQNANKVLSLI